MIPIIISIPKCMVCVVWSCTKYCYVQWGEKFRIHKYIHRRHGKVVLTLSPACWGLCLRWATSWQFHSFFLHTHMCCGTKTPQKDTEGLEGAVWAVNAMAPSGREIVDCWSLRWSGIISWSSLNCLWCVICKFTQMEQCVIVVKEGSKEAWVWD